MLGYKYSVPDIAGYKTYGRLELTVTSPVQTFVEPLDIDADVKPYLQMDANHEDTVIQGLMIAAREIAEEENGRDFVSKQYDLTLDRWPDELRLRSPLASVDSFSWKDASGTSTTMTAGTNYVVDLVRGLMVPPWGAIWPMRAPLYPSGAITVRFTTAAAPLPATVKHGMLMLIRHWFDQRIPFEIARGTMQELPYGVRRLFESGSRRIFA